MYNEFYHLNIGAAIKVLNKNTGIKYNDKGENVGIKDETQSIGRYATYVRKALNTGVLILREIRFVQQIMVIY